jgi:hypothetical protein
LCGIHGVTPCIPFQWDVHRYKFSLLRGICP